MCHDGGCNVIVVVKSGSRWCRPWWSDSDVAEREALLDEDDVARREHTTRVNVVTLVAAVVRWVADEDALESDGGLSLCSVVALTFG
jgi:hypothetical protein